jgi:large repetitive protein
MSTTPTITAKSTTNAGGVTVKTSKQAVTQVALQPGMRITVEVDGAPLSAQQLADKQLKVSKVGDSLVLEMPDGSSVELVDFYITEDVVLNGDFWVLPADAALVQTNQGLVHQLVQAVEVQDTGVLGQELIASAPETAANASGVSLGGFVALGGAALAIAGSGSVPVAAAVSETGKTLSITVVAGPLLPTHQLAVEAYGQDGQQLFARTSLTLDTDGKFLLTLPAGYNGPVLVRVVDLNTGDDYVDEATGAGVDLSIDLRALVDVSDSDAAQQAIVVSPLSELVVQAVLGDAGGSEGASAVEFTAAQAGALRNTDKAIAEALGLPTTEAIARQAVEPVITVDNKPVAGNLPGLVLAAISGYEAGNDGGTQNAIQALSDSIGEKSGETVGDYLLKGVLNVGNDALTTLLDQVATVKPVFTSGASGTVDENAALVKAIYTAAMNNTAPVSYSLKAGVDDESMLEIDNTTGVVTLKASANYEAKSSYAFTVVATNAGTSATLTTEQAVTVGVTDLNDVAPVFTSGASGTVAENAALSTAIYTAATTDADGTAANKAVSYSLKAGVGDVGLLNINSTTGVVTLKASANYETKPSYAFTVVATNTGTGHSLQA